MLHAYGWCILRTSREKYKNATLDEVDAIDDEVDAADRVLWRAFRAWMTDRHDDLFKWHFYDEVNHDRGVLLFFTSRNHRGSSLWDVLEWISTNATGSYGLVHVHDDEDLVGVQQYGRGTHDYSKVFRVHRILNGQREELEDQYLSPIVPRINCSELA
jgi:hypothetical protein